MSVQLRSGQVAAAAGVNLETLRYYERRGLLERPDRTLGGHRVYPAEAVTLLRIIKTAQRLGFSLAEVGDLLDVAAHRHELARPHPAVYRAVGHFQQHGYYDRQWPARLSKTQRSFWVDDHSDVSVHILPAQTAAHEST